MELVLTAHLVLGDPLLLLLLILPCLLAVRALVLRRGAVRLGRVVVTAATGLPA